METQLCDDLRALVADQPFVPTVAPAEQRGRRLRRRGTVIRGVAVVSVVAGITATALVVHHTAATRPEQIATAPVPAIPAPAAPAQLIVDRTVAAVAAQDAVLRVTGDDHRTTYDSVHQDYELTYLSGGTPTWTKAIRQTGPGKFEMRVIDYQKQVWADTTEVDAVVLNPGTQIINALKEDETTRRNGCAKVVDTATVDGQLADKLALFDRTCQNSTGWMWISRATSLPITSESAGETLTYQWSGAIDPAGMWPAAPAGFEQIQPTMEFLDQH